MMIISRTPPAATPTTIGMMKDDDSDESIDPDNNVPVPAINKHHIVVSS